MKIEHDDDVMRYTLQASDSWDPWSEPGFSFEAALFSATAGALLSADNSELPTPLSLLITPCLHLSRLFGEQSSTAVPALAPAPPALCSLFPRVGPCSAVDVGDSSPQCSLRQPRAFQVQTWLAGSDVCCALAPAHPH